MQNAGITMTLKPEEQSTEINDVIARQVPGRGLAEPPGLRPRHPVGVVALRKPAGQASADPGSTAPVAKNIGPPSADGPVGNNCDNAVNFSKFNDPEINKDLETGRTSTDPAIRKAAYEDLNKEFAKQVWEAWALLVGMDDALPDQHPRDPRTEPPDGDVTRRHRRAARRRTPASRAASTSRGSGSRKAFRQQEAKRTRLGRNRSEGCEQHCGV